MQKNSSDTPIGFLTALFFVSGFASLIYQIAWQRVLFAAFGSDLESVTIVVAAFMLGLGFGALFGGRLADRFPKNALMLFCCCEIGIGIYGLVSFHLMSIAGDQFVSSSLLIVAIVNFLLVLFPALLMGATLPILIAHTVRCWGNVGSSTGHLYAANTLGAALGAFSTAFVLFSHMHLDSVISLAATLNLCVAFSGMLRLGKSK